MKRISIFFIFLGIFLFYFIYNYTSVLQTITVPEKIYHQCLLSMKNNTCTIMLGPQLEFLKSTDKIVLIAGFGEVETRIYRQIRDNPFMCEEIKNHCNSDLNSSVCSLAKSMYETLD